MSFKTNEYLLFGRLDNIKQIRLGCIGCNLDSLCKRFYIGECYYDLHKWVRV